MAAIHKAKFINAYVQGGGYVRVYGFKEVVLWLKTCESLEIPAKANFYAESHIMWIGSLDGEEITP
jgi:hypothetical protein